MIEISLLKLLGTKSVYDKYADTIDSFTLTREAELIVKYLAIYFTQTKSDEVDWALCKDSFILHNSRLGPDTLVTYAIIFDNIIAEPTVSDPKPILNTLSTRLYAGKIADLTMGIAEGTLIRDLDDVHNILDEYNQAIGRVKEDGFTRLSVHDLVEETKSGRELLWRLDCLNQSVGPLRPQSFVIVGSRPETGKTTFLADQSTYMAEQMNEGEKVLWFNNEEAYRKVRYRQLCAALGWTENQINSDPLEATKRFEKLMKGDTYKIEIFDQDIISTNEVESVLKEYEGHIGLIIFDQLWKIKGFSKASTDTDRLTQLFGWARGLTKRYAPGIAVHQVTAEGEGIKYVPMDMLYMSKTGIQGEADAIITIGNPYDDSDPNLRGLYVPKNKLGGADPSLRNGRFDIAIQKEIARYKEYK